MGSPKLYDTGSNPGYGSYDCTVPGSRKRSECPHYKRGSTENSQCGYLAVYLGIVPDYRVQHESCVGSTHVGCCQV
jgi:hypothetical protein